MLVKYKSNKGFTLAEVLITLGIIGVVAAMTIPTLVASYQKTAYVTSLKKFYSTMTSALKQYSNDMGCPGDLSCTGLFGGAVRATVHANIRDALRPYFKTVKDCGTATAQGCFPGTLTMDSTGSQSLDWSDGFKFITLDGMSVIITDYYTGDNCDANSGSGALKAVCGTIYVDVNGPLKKPNQSSRDVFEFDITNSGDLYPHGGHNYSNSAFRWDGGNKTGFDCTIWGYGCAGRVMEDGWQMNY